MTAIPFNSQLIYGITWSKEKNSYISMVEINKDWSMECGWSQKSPSRPEFLQFYRKSTGDEILVSGTFTLIRDDYNPTQRKFMHLMEAGSKTFVIVLDYSSDYEKYDLTNLSITGSMKISLNESCLSDDYECLLDSEKTFFSDVEITCGTESFSAHKNILCARSPVFAAMFSTEMKERQGNKVNITDLSPEVVNAMLIYIYSGKTGEFSFQSAGELLFAADKYQLQDLLRVCCHFLKSCVSVQNVLKTLVLGELHDKDLKSFAMDFICNKCEEFEVLEKTEEWKNLRENRPSLAMDVLSGLVISTNKKLKNHK